MVVYQQEDILPTCAFCVYFQKREIYVEIFRMHSTFSEVRVRFFLAKSRCFGGKHQLYPE